MIYLQVVLVLGLLVLIVALALRAPTVPADRRRPVSSAGEWRVAHHDVEETTRVVVEKVAPGGDDVLDEHVVALLATDDPEYDEKFLTAMATARQRQALFEAEER